MDLKYEDWIAAAKEKFGDNPMNWKFKCPSCGYIASVKEWKDAGAPEGAVAFSCIGRYTGSTKELGEKPGPCNYAGGGLFRLNPIKVERDGKITEVFEFAE